MSRYRINPADCPHPDFAIQYAWSRQNGGDEHAMYCSECGWERPVRNAEDFVKQRELKYLHDEGRDAATKRDMFGNEISVGSMVVYPSLSGRSATLSYGKVVEINPPTKAVLYPDKWSTWARRPRADAPDRLKVQPMPYTSRWKSWRGEDAKPVTLSANAPSVVVMK